WFGGVGGGVPYENIKGRALFVWLSSSIFTSDADWSRIFAPVMGRPPGHGPFGSQPPAMKALDGAIDKCLRERPPLARTHPPKGGQVVR
ncbi:MAG TPA: hypothetical protein VIF62_27080, partial [Labilithrix sp.]